MPGLYLHIPFCKQACTYCNFHFSTNLRSKPALISAICSEIAYRHQFLSDLSPSISSVYFGGGTPSLLTEEEFGSIWDSINRYFSIDREAEITLEANPDDLTPWLLDWLSRGPVNRLSIGVQSFFDSELTFMNRAHTAREAREAIDRARDAGFANLNIDLIYGTPGLTDAEWQANLEYVSSKQIPHLSAYQLTIEEKTALAHQVRKGVYIPADDDKVARQFVNLDQWATDHGYVHYEISNLCLPGMQAEHNSSYWNGSPYLGLGPSAHSYNGYKRMWNIANNAAYVRLIQAEGQAVAASETLGNKDRYNEIVMTGLRLSEGLDAGRIAQLGDEYVALFKRLAQPFLQRGLLIKTGTRYTLTLEGKLLADHIASECFAVSD